MRNKLSGLTQQQIDELIAYKERNKVGPAQSPVMQNQMQKPQAAIDLNFVQPNDPSKTESFGRGFVDTLSLGYAPKVGGAIAAGVAPYVRPELFENDNYADLYKTSRDQIRSDTARAAEVNPVSSFAGNLTGAALIPFKAATIPEAAGIGGLYGGAYGLGSSDEGEVGTINADNVISGLYNAGVGALTGGVGQGIYNKFFSPKKAPNPEIRDRINLFEEAGLPITKGEATQDINELLKEESARMGRMSDNSARRINEFDKMRKEGYKNYAEEVRKELGGGKQYLEKGAHVNESVESLKSKALKEREEYSNLYQEAKEGVGKLPGEKFTGLTDNIAQDLEKEALTIDNVPGAYGELNGLTKLLKKGDSLGNIELNSIEAWRQGLNRAYRGAVKGGRDQEAYALNQVKNKFDGFMDGVIEKALEEGDFSALQKLKESRSLAANWHNKYSAKNPQEYGKKFLQDVIKKDYTPEQIVNKMFGTSELGFKAETASIINEVKKHFNTDEFNNIRLETAQRLIAPLLKNNANVTTYKSNLDRFIKQNPTLVKGVFDKDQIKDLQKLGDIGDIIFNRPKSTFNTSGTANVILNYLANNKYSKFITNLFKRVELNQDKVKKGALKNEKINAPMSAPFRAGVVNNIKPTTTSESAISDTKNEVNQISEIAHEQRKFDELSQEMLDDIISRKENISHNKTNEDKLLNKIALIESGNNPNAKSSTSSASGLFQLTNPTWEKLVSKYNVSGDKNDPLIQRELAKKLLNENKEILSSNLKRMPLDGELYVAHFLGPKDAIRLIEAQGSRQLAARLFPAAAKANKNIFFSNNKPKTVEEVYQTLVKKI